MPAGGPPDPPVLSGAALALDELLLDGAEVLADGGGPDDAAGEVLATVLPELSSPQPENSSGKSASALMASALDKPLNDMGGFK
jgi:hypothetical protein